MQKRYNPYYSPEKLQLNLLSFDEPGLSYEYNTLCFWSTNNGRIYTAQDSGCSCPTPFEDYEGSNQEEVIQKLERIGSVKQALNIFNSWNNSFPSYSQSLDISKRLEAWIKENLKYES